MANLVQYIGATVKALTRNKVPWITYVATQGTLASLLTSGALNPGDRLILRGSFTGDFVCTLAGTASNPIIIDARGATLNGWLWMDDDSSAQYVYVEGLDVGYLDWATRDIDDTNNPPVPVSQTERSAFRLDMPNVKLRRCGIHDDRVGVGFWVPATGGQIDECHIYHNGWNNPVIGPDVHGEGVYAQGSSGTRVLRKIVAHDNFDHNIVLYDTAASVKNFTLEDNILFNDEFQVGGQTAMENILLRRNLVKGSLPTGLGFQSVANVSLAAQDNYFSQINGYYQGLIVRRFATLGMTGNVIAMPQCTYAVWIDAPPANFGDWEWDNNTYYVTKNTAFRESGPWFYVAGHNDLIDNAPYLSPETGTTDWPALTWDRWREVTGWDANSTIQYVLPSDSIYVQLSAYANAAMVTIWNWSEASSQNVDLGALPQGRYRAFNAQNLSEYFDFDWAGAAAFAMTGWTNSIPIGHDEALEPVSFPSFGVFLVEER